MLFHIMLWMNLKSYSYFCPSQEGCENKLYGHSLLIPIGYSICAGGWKCALLYGSDRHCGRHLTDKLQKSYYKLEFVVIDTCFYFRMPVFTVFK